MSIFSINLNLFYHLSELADIATIIASVVAVISLFAGLKRVSEIKNITQEMNADFRKYIKSNVTEIKGNVNLSGSSSWVSKQSTDNEYTSNE